MLVKVGILSEISEIGAFTVFHCLKGADSDGSAYCWGCVRRLLIFLIISPYINKSSTMASYKITKKTSNPLKNCEEC